METDIVNYFSTGLTVLKAVGTLIESGVSEENIYLISLFASPTSQLLISNQRIKQSIFVSNRGGGYVMYTAY